MLYGNWIRPLTYCGLEAQLLVAASISLERLRELLDGVTAAMLRAWERNNPRKNPRRGAIKHRQAEDQSAGEAFTGLLCVLEGIQCISTIIAGQEEYEPLKRPDDSSVGLYERLGFGDPDYWSPDALLSLSLVSRALEREWGRVHEML
ncbi:MAG: hypothetical protein ACKO1M_01045, partial [Planctomycetota bacterium]